MFLARRRRKNVARGINCQAGYFPLGSAVEHESFALRRDPVDQTAPVRSGNEISFGIQGQYPYVRLVALEEHRMLAVRSDFKNLSMISGGDVEIAALIEGQRPYVLGPRIEVDRGSPIAKRRNLGILRGSF